MESHNKTEYHILNLGAGVQSTTLYLMFMRGEIQPQIDCAIFADTQDEPQEVYRHLDWLKSLNGPRILVRTAGCLSADLIEGRRAPGASRARFASIPAFTTSDGGVTRGKTKRQCSAEYKVWVIERSIRRDVLNLQPRQRIPKGVFVRQYLGISLDEAGRASRIAKRYRETIKWATPHFPLVERFWTRPDCLTWLADKVPHQCPRSACVFCPYHSDSEWVHIRETDRNAWDRAVRLDQMLRTPGVIVNRDTKQVMYLHKSCKPLSEVQFDTRPTQRDMQLSMSFAEVCEGVCGV